MCEHKKSFKLPTIAHRLGCMLESHAELSKTASCILPNPDPWDSDLIGLRWSLRNWIFKIFQEILMCRPLGNYWARRASCLGLGSSAQRSWMEFKRPLDRNAVKRIPKQGVTGWLIRALSSFKFLNFLDPNKIKPVRWALVQHSSFPSLFLSFVLCISVNLDELTWVNHLSRVNSATWQM